jgi:hypothetical protein
VVNIYTGVLPASQWSMTVDASGLLGAYLTAAYLTAACPTGGAPAISPLGIAMSGRKEATVTGGECAVAHRRFRPDAAASPAASAAATPAVATTLFGQPTVSQQTTNNQYVTSVDVDGVGASGPPRKRETA